MSETTEATESALTTSIVVEAVAWERAPRYPGRQVNRRIVCADGFAVSVQASTMHYAEDSSGQAPYWAIDPVIRYPFTTFEVGNPSSPIDWPTDDEGSAVWPWVARQRVADLLDEHGGAVAWEPPTPFRPKPAREPESDGREGGAA